MKKVLLWIMILAVVMASSSTASASDWFEDVFSMDTDLEQRWNTGIITSAVITSESDFSNGLQISAVGSYDIFKFLAIGVECGWTGFIDARGGGIDAGTLSYWSILGDVIFKVPIEMDDYLLVPYVVNGFGGVIPSFDESDTATRMGVAVDCSPAFLYKFGGGLDFYITEIIGLNFEGSYQWADIDCKATRYGTFLGSGPSKLDAWYLGGGVKVKF